MLDSSQRPGGPTEDSPGRSLSQEIHGFQLGSLPFYNGTGTVFLTLPPLFFHFSLPAFILKGALW